ncbi:EMC6-like membrane protein [Methanobrevibacter filiformis]|uniref:Uncharacterized protein n=1 Tax=Methanobrevibacter filiformis TaxID=55758 RepID=A0A165ZH78_9EURY|nr:DUF5379 family protein [Methanobrevibacter filiformis]KZX10711.1 hypothetical protein MBFIL_16230 [Methanobrevibacter filiformis]
METGLKVCLIHVVAAILASIASAALSLGWLSFFGENMVFASLIGLVVLYVVGQLCERIFGKEEVGGFRRWLSDGIIPFGLVWFVVWTLLFNYLGPF